MKSELEMASESPGRKFLSPLPQKVSVKWLLLGDGPRINASERRDSFVVVTLLRIDADRGHRLGVVDGMQVLV
jgi:hypothetical protein